ncbi:MAG TPA: hypothetical protein VK955_06490 [Xanthobacteraceae bacterium]|nr:hypothetical protein [Xanthobacteraceae bacterium]
MRHFLLDLRAELLRRGLDRAGAGLAHGLLRVGVVGHLDQDLRHLADDRFRRLRRSHDRVPGFHEEVRNDGFVHRGQIGEVGAAFERGHRQAADQPGLDLRQSIGHVGERKVDLAGKHRRSRLRTALEGNMHDLGAGARLEQFHGIMRQAADAAGAVVELAGIGLRISDKLGHRLYRQILLDDDRLHD